MNSAAEALPRVNWAALNVKAIVDSEKCMELQALLVEDRDRIVPAVNRWKSQGRTRSDRTSRYAYITPEQLLAAERVISAMARKYNELSARLGVLNRQRKQQNHLAAQATRRSFDAFFREVARDSVDLSVYEDWCREAESRLAKQEQA